MLALDRVKIMRIKSELREARVRSQDILEDSKRLIQEYRQTVEHTRQLLEKSHQLRTERQRGR
jgi:hypothetical protein